jgi:FAD dependent oxidoreductase TIGR03364
MSQAYRRLVVVGGGILGTMHALEGVQRGYEVVHLERDERPRGASVRNFGLVWVGGRQSGKELALALRARERWADIGRRAPRTGFRPCGSVTIASTPGELAVLEDVAARDDAAVRGFRLLDPDEVRDANPAVVGKVLGGLFCVHDAAVEPRDTLAALRELCSTIGTYRYLPGRHVLEIDDGAVRDQTGQRHEADLVVCCIGAEAGGIFAELLKTAPLRRVRLQMLETTPYRTEISTALADGDSLRYYPAYAGETLDRLEPQDDLPASWAAQLLLVQRRGGHLTIGDTHRYAEPFEFDLHTAPYAHLLGVAERLLGEPLAVERYWEGIYSQVTDERLIYLRWEVAPGVVVVTGPGGRGMTMSPAIAEETFA